MGILTLAEYKSMLSVVGVTNDAMVNTLIPIVQNQIETYLDRKLDNQTNYEWKPYSPTLILDQYPVTKLTMIGSLYQVATLNPSTGYQYQINNDYGNSGINSGMTVTKISDFTSNTIPFTTAPHLEELQTRIEALYPGVITMNIVSGYEFQNYRTFKPGTGKDIYAGIQLDCNTRLVDNRTIEFLQDASFLFLAATDLCSDVQVLVMYETGYATADVPQTLKLVAANVIKNIVNIMTSGQGTPGARSGFYTMEQWQPETKSYMYQVSDVTVLEIAKQVERYEKMLWPWRKKGI